MASIQPCLPHTWSLAVDYVIGYSLRRRANARNVSFRISLRWLIHIVNLVDKTQLSRYTSHRRSTTVSLETYPSITLFMSCYSMATLL